MGSPTAIPINPDLLEPGQEGGAAHRIVDLEHHGGDQFAALGHERVLGAQLLGDLRLAALLDEQHLVDLASHGRVVLEKKHAIGTHLQAPVAFRLHQRAPARLALLGVPRHRNNVLRG